ncbi:MAG: DUF4910 domain-containing protein [Endomicrobiales bacterium]|nr:DUF4910 domain-containing protein [Endomicrobiales bacterium]
MSNMLELLKQIYPLQLAPISSDTEKAFDIIKRQLPGEVELHEYPSGMEFNGWIVPQSWGIKKAEIRKNGKLIYDGTKHVLGVMSYSKSFTGDVSLDELKKHLTFRKDQPAAVGYHCDYFIKQWTADWGMSVPYNLYKKLQKGTYNVDLQTVFRDGRMKVLDCFLPGKSPETVILNAHSCHAGQANDGASGIAVGMELMNRLSKRKNKYSYRFIITAEHLGTVFYLSKIPKETLKTFKHGIFLEMLGNNNRLIVQKSLLGDNLIDKIAEHYVETYEKRGQTAPFRKVVGNDETVWEAAGYEVPMISVSRWPYKEYHTSLDDEKIISEKKLEESAAAIEEMLFILDTNCRMIRKFEGLIALSNPKYDLYMKPGTDPSIPETVPEEGRKFNYMMDFLPRYFDGKTTVLDIAVKHGLRYRSVYNYICKFKGKGLVEFV